MSYALRGRFLRAETMSDVMRRTAVRRKVLTRTHIVEAEHSWAATTLTDAGFCLGVLVVGRLFCKKACGRRQRPGGKREDRQNPSESTRAKRRGLIGEKWCVRKKKKKRKNSYYTGFYMILILRIVEKIKS